MVGSNVLPGKYWINFTKFESTGSTFYKPILPVLITVVAGTNQSNNATIAAKLTTYSYIGYPIVVPIVLSVPSASPMTLVIAVKEEFNGSLLSYSKAYGNYSVAPRVINISAGVSEVNFTILYYNNTVPPGITLLLSISSLYPLYYTLTTPVLYVSFQKDPKYQGIYVPMKVTVSNVSFVSTDDVGKSILNVFVNNQTQNVSFAPVIIAMNQTMRGSTWSNLLINTKEEYTLYWCVLEQGYTEPTAYSDLTTLSYPNCRDKGRMQSTKNPLQLVNCEAWVNSTILECNTKYNLFAVAYNSMGYSPVSKLTFTTAELSLGAEMKLSLNGIVPANKIITALQQTLGISASRIKVTTSYLDLQNMYKANNTNTYNYTYTVVIAPNPINDLPAPIDLVGGMVNSSAMLASLGRNLDSWNQKSPIPYRVNLFLNLARYDGEAQGGFLPGAQADLLLQRHLQRQVLGTGKGLRHPYGELHGLALDTELHQHYQPGLPCQPDTDPLQQANPLRQGPEQYRAERLPLLQRNFRQQGPRHHLLQRLETRLRLHNVHDGREHAAVRAVGASQRHRGRRAIFPHHPQSK